MRHEPMGESFFSQHSVGMRIAGLRAASRIVLPLGTLTGLPSMVRLIMRTPSAFNSQRSAFSSQSLSLTLDAGLADR